MGGRKGERDAKRTVEGYRGAVLSRFHFSFSPSPSSPCVHRSMYRRLPTEARRLSLTPGAGATPGELSDVGLGFKLQSSAKAASAFNC